MTEIPDSPADVPKIVKSLLGRIRNGEKAERDLIALLGSHAAVATRLRDEGILAANSRNPDAEIPLQDALAAWCEELAPRADRFHNFKAFWEWFSASVRSARKSAVGQALDEQRAIVGLAFKGQEDSASSAALSRSIASSGLLIRDEMKAFESLFRQPKENQGKDFFEDLCRTLFRVRIWVYLLRRRRSPDAAREDLVIKDSALACLVYGFGLEKNDRKNKGRKIFNWLRPSMAEFNEYEDRELIRRIRGRVDSEGPAA